MAVDDTPEAIRPYLWKPGQSGNPSGRPKAIFAKAYRKYLELAFPAEGEAGEAFDQVMAKALKDGATIAEVIALQQIGQALKGKLYPTIEIADRVDGKPKQTQQIVGPDDGPLQNLNIDITKLDSTELRELAKMLGKVQGAPGGTAPEEPPTEGDK